MAWRVQQNPYLRCTDCDGYGWKPVLSVVERRHQAGEDTCGLCGGNGTKRDVRAPVKVRPLPKQKRLTVNDLEHLIHHHVEKHGLHFRLGLNESEDGDYDGYVWLSDADKEKALSEGSIWTIYIFGRLLEPALCLAASSLSTLLQMLAQYEFQPAASVARERMRTQ